MPGAYKRKDKIYIFVQGNKVSCWGGLEDRSNYSNTIDLIKSFHVQIPTSRTHAIHPEGICFILKTSVHKPGGFEEKRLSGTHSYTAQTSYGFLTSHTDTCPSGCSLIVIPSGTHAGGSPLGTCPPSPLISLQQYKIVDILF